MLGTFQKIGLFWPLYLILDQGGHLTVQATVDSTLLHGWRTVQHLPAAADVSGLT